MAERWVLGVDLWQWRRMAQQQAQAATVPLFELDWFLQALTELDALALRLESFKTASQVRSQLSLAELHDRWQQRCHDRVPVQYLVGKVHWRTFNLQVSPAVLIPRPETEGLIDLAIAAVQEAPHLQTGHWADLGTGSGAIAIGLATAFPWATVHGVDCSTDALSIARENAETANVSDRIQFHSGSWLEPLTPWQGHLSGLVSNPPYIPSALLSTLAPEVVHHEPTLALDGGVDGLDSVRQLVSVAPCYLQSGAVWLVELMVGQAPLVVDLLKNQGNYRDIRSFPDLAGIERFVLAYRR